MSPGLSFDGSSAGVTHITSRDNPLIKDLRKLSQDSAVCSAFKNLLDRIGR